MRRREFIAGLGGAAVWPVAAWAQQEERVRRVGILVNGSSTQAPAHPRVDAFKQGLAGVGWIEGRNLAFEERWAEADATRLPTLATQLAALKPDLIFVLASLALSAMRRATGTIPIVFAVVADPVGQGFVWSLANPGGNITGFASGEFGVATKRLDLLKKLAPNLERIAFFDDPAQPASAGTLAEIEAAAPVFHVEVSKIAAGNAEEIEASIATFAQAPNGGLLVLESRATIEHRELIISLAAHHRLPALSTENDFVTDGGLASYAAHDVDLCRRAASYVDRILRGAKPAELPVQLPTKFELAINLKTAKALGIEVPPTLLALADEVIE
jgi:putative tryptophan/tyrosine transport system substrate-binding protein